MEDVSARNLHRWQASKVLQFPPPTEVSEEQVRAALISKDSCKKHGTSKKQALPAMTPALVKQGGKAAAHWASKGSSSPKTGIHGTKIVLPNLKQKWLSQVPDPNSPLTKTHLSFASSNEAAEEKEEVPEAEVQDYGNTQPDLAFLKSIYDSSPAGGAYTTKISKTRLSLLEEESRRLNDSILESNMSKRKRSLVNTVALVDDTAVNFTKVTSSLTTYQLFRKRNLEKAREQASSRFGNP